MSVFRPATGLVVNSGGGGGGGGIFEVKDGIIQPINKYLESNMIIGGEFQATEIEVISDIIYKDDIKNINKENVDKLDKLEPKQYMFKKKRDKIHYGFIAQDFEKLFPNREIMMLETENINYGGGNIHCITMNVPKI